MSPLLTLAATVAFGLPLHAPVKQGAGGYVPIVQQQGDNLLPPAPPTFPPLNQPATGTTTPFQYAFAVGSQGDFTEQSANYELSVKVITSIVDGVVTGTRNLEGSESVTGPLNTSIRVGATDPCYGLVAHGQLGMLTFNNLANKAIQLTAKRTFPIVTSKNTYKTTFVVPAVSQQLQGGVESR